MKGPWEAALPHERWQQSRDSAPVPQTVGLGHRGVSSDRSTASQPQPLGAMPSDRSSGTVLSELLAESSVPPPPTSSEGRPARAGRRAGRPATAQPRLQATDAGPQPPARPAARAAQHGRRADRTRDCPEAPSVDSQVSDIAQQVLDDANAEAGSPPSYGDLDAKLRALSGRDPKLAGMLDGQPRGSAKVMEQALELERLSGEVAKLQRKLANTEQLLREAEHSLKHSEAKQEAADAKSAALSRQMEQREASFRGELAKSQRDFNEQLTASRAEAERVVQAAEQRVEAIKLEAAQRQSQMQEDMADQVEQVRRRADERVAQIQVDAEAARDATPLIRSAPATTADAERIVALEAELRKARDDLGKERKRTRNMVKEHGSRKSELLEAQSAVSKHEAECHRLRTVLQDSEQAEAATAKATMLQKDLESMRTEAARQSGLRDDLVSQISHLRSELEEAKAKVRMGESRVQVKPQDVGGESVAKMRDELASLKAERLALLRDQEEATVQMEAMRRKLNAAAGAQSLTELTGEYDRLKAAGNLAEAFPIGQRIRQLQRQGHHGASDNDKEGAYEDNDSIVEKRNVVQAGEEVAAVRKKLQESEARCHSLCKVHRVMESHLVTAQLGHRMLKVELENTREMLAEMEAEVRGAGAPQLTLSTADPKTVSDLLSSKTRSASAQPVHEPEPQPQPELEPEPAASSGWGMGSLLSTVKTTFAWGVQSKTSQVAVKSKQIETSAAALDAEQEKEGTEMVEELTSNESGIAQDDKLVTVRAMMISKGSDNPSAEDVYDYACNILDIDVEAYPHLIWIAEEALLQVDLPNGWVERIDATGRTFYKNKSTKDTTYTNPIDTAYRELYQLQVQKEEAKASKRARQHEQGTAEDRALQKLASTHEGQCAILLNFYRIADGGRTQEDVDRILRKRWHNGAQALSKPQWDSLAQKMKDKYSQCPMELWQQSNTISTVEGPPSETRSKSKLEQRSEQMNYQRLQSRLESD